MHKKDSTSVSSKESIEQGFKELIGLLSEARSELEKMKGQNEQLNLLMKPVKRALAEEMSKAQKEMSNSMESIPWDRLVIAFFGETNAGKSTIIETLRILFESNHTKGADGLIVGDGSHDFTKDYHEYSLSINGQPFTLIDVPGIEGDENVFKDIITEALSKAHCVFYVQGHNKKPDEATATKIKDYLGDWVNVYSIQNVRGAVTDYDEEDERIMLLNESVLRNGDLIENRFREILNRVYKGNIPLQALLAMCAKASFSPQRPDLIKTQRKLLKFFGSEDAIFKFSEFQAIIDLIEDKSANFKLEIANSNRQKMYSLANGIIQKVNGLIKGNQEKADEFENSLHTFKRDLSAHYNDARNSIRNKVPSSLFAQFNQLQQDLFAVIDDDNSTSEQKKIKVDNIIAEFMRDLASILSLINNEIESLKRKVEHSKRSLEAFSFAKVDLSINSLQVDFDMEDLRIAVEELDIHCDDVSGFLAAVTVGAGVGSFGGPWGIVIGGVVGGLVHGIKTLFGDHGKGVAKSLIQKTLQTSRNKANEELDKKLLRDIDDKLHESEKGIIKKIDNEIGTYNNFNHEVEDLKFSIYKYEQKLKNFAYGTI